MILKEILERISVLHIKSLKTKEGRNFSLPLSNSSTCYAPSDIFEVRTTLLCATCILVQLHQTSPLNKPASCMRQGAGNLPALSSQKSIHVTTSWGRFCSCWLGESQGYFGEKLWNIAIRIVAYNYSIKTNISYFWAKLSTAFLEEADLCMQQRNHFKHNQRNSLCWQKALSLHFDLKTTELSHTVPNLKGKTC